MINHDESGFITIHRFQSFHVEHFHHYTFRCALQSQELGLASLRMKALPSAVSCASQEFAVDMSWPAGERMGTVGKSSRMTHVHV